MRFDTRQRTSSSALFSKPERRRFLRAFRAAALLILAASLTLKGAELNSETLTAWGAYVQAQNARVAEYTSATPFLWSDRSPDRLRRLHNGETVVAPFGENRAMRPASYRKRGLAAVAAILTASATMSGWSAVVITARNTASALARAGP